VKITDLSIITDAKGELKPGASFLKLEVMKRGRNITEETHAFRMDSVFNSVALVRRLGVSDFIP
jgi:hypothetical protein